MSSKLYKSLGVGSRVWYYLCENDKEALFLAFFVIYCKEVL